MSGGTWTGPDHYRKAQTLVDQALARRIHADEFTLDPTERQTLLAAAQVHATLAATAAQIETAYAVATRGSDGGIQQAWIDVVSPRPIIHNHPEEQRP